MSVPVMEAAAEITRALGGVARRAGLFITVPECNTMGLAMLAGGFIGPKLTELITLDQYKFVFGWILIILAALMFWQTTPGYMNKNKKEQAIMSEYKKRAEAAAKAK
jgi:uncharacterized membrane protein YfcA